MTPVPPSGRFRPVAPTSPRKLQVLVCRGPECGGKRGSAQIFRALADELRARLRGGPTVVLDWQSCFGQCRRGVNVLVRELKSGDDGFLLSFRPGAGAALYHGVKPADVSRIVGEHILGGTIIDELRRRG